LDEKEGGGGWAPSKSTTVNEMNYFTSFLDLPLTLLNICLEVLGCLIPCRCYDIGYYYVYIILTYLHSTVFVADVKQDPSLDVYSDYIYDISVRKVYKVSKHSMFVISMHKAC
jgi:hypothetical protein